nr:LuxD [Candidatus Photodesmus katoptron]
MDHSVGLSEYLSTNGFLVIRYDSLNHVGLSSGNIDKFTMTIGEKSLLAVIHWLNDRGFYNIGLIAISLSARIAYQVVSKISLSFLITSVGVVNLRNTLKKALGFDYLRSSSEDFPSTLELKGYKLEAKNFFLDCLKHHWADLSSTIDRMKDFSAPFIVFIASDDVLIEQNEVLEMLSNIKSGCYKVYSLLGSPHDLSKNLIILRKFYSSITKAAIGLDIGKLNLFASIDEPEFEKITISTVNERRLKIKIASQS